MGFLKKQTNKKITFNPSAFNQDRLKIVKQFPDIVSDRFICSRLLNSLFGLFIYLVKFTFFTIFFVDPFVVDTFVVDPSLKFFHLLVLLQCFYFFQDSSLTTQNVQALLSFIIIEIVNVCTFLRLADQI